MIPNIWECLLRLTLSALFGGIVGLERELRLKGAGVRTHLIVCFASCMMMLVSKYGFFDVLMSGYDTVKFDPARISAGLVTAIGFMGAGTIFARGRGVSGLTTSAGLWATVGIGMTAGAGMYLVSAFSAVFIVAVQLLLYRDHPLLGKGSAVLYVQIEDRPETLDSLHEQLGELGLAAQGSKYERIGGLLSIELKLEQLPCPQNELGQLLSPLAKQPYVKSLLW